MTGLDPQASYDLKQMMRQHADRGKTVIFSTHVLEVAEQLCDKIAILKKGNLIFYGTIEELKGQHPEQSLESIYLSLAGRKEEGGNHASYCLLYTSDPSDRPQRPRILLNHLQQLCG